MAEREGEAMAAVDGVEVRGRADGEFARILTPEALTLLARLQRELGPRRNELLQARVDRWARLRGGELPDFLAATASVRSGSWQVAAAPSDLQKRWVEITGPTDRKMVINALNCGANVFMADFEDANTPSWDNLVDGQINLIDANDRSIEFLNPDGRVYKLNDKVATLLVRPRGWHLVEKHVLVDGEPMSASLFDFGLYAFHNTERLMARGSAPYFYLPKMESHLEARLWNDAFVLTQQHLGVPLGTYRATVLIETILAAFEMEEILYELRDHSSGLNAGRWDYMFSTIKKFCDDPSKVLPDRAQVTMTAPFMRSYTEQLVRACHRHGAHAIGGMAAFIPNRRDPEVTENALARVRDDKTRESGDGFDGTWVAHPDLVPIAQDVFQGALGGRANQVDRLREDVTPDAASLIDLTVPGGTVTDAGVRTNINVGIQYIESWLRGVGAAAINNLMEDAATAEISRSQLWQWIRHGTKLDDGRTVTAEMVRTLEAEELANLREMLGSAAYEAGRFADATKIFENVALAEEYVEFLTIPAYEYLD
jgi:malate synthase